MNTESPALPACCTPAPNASLAAIAYAAYNAGGDPATAGRNFMGAPCPEWDALPVNVRAKWEAQTAVLLTQWEAQTAAHLQTVLSAGRRPVPPFPTFPTETPLATTKVRVATAPVDVDDACAASITHTMDAIGWVDALELETTDGSAIYWRVYITEVIIAGIPVSVDPAVTYREGRPYMQWVFAQPQLIAYGQQVCVRVATQPGVTTQVHGVIVMHAADPATFSRVMESVILQACPAAFMEMQTATFLTNDVVAGARTAILGYTIPRIGWVKSVTVLVEDPPAGLRIKALCVAGVDVTVTEPLQWEILAGADRRLAAYGQTIRCVLDNPAELPFMVQLVVTMETLDNEVFNVVMESLVTDALRPRAPDGDTSPRDNA